MFKINLTNHKNDNISETIGQTNINTCRVSELNKKNINV